MKKVLLKFKNIKKEMNLTNDLENNFEELNEKKLRYFLYKQDKEKISMMGIKEGFNKNDLRVKLYELIIGFDLEKKEIEYQSFLKNDELENNKKINKYNYIIEADVERSFRKRKLEEKDLIEKKNILKKVLIHFFQKNSQFSYYQGFNSVAEIFVLNFKEDIAYILLEEFSFYLLQDFLLLENFTKSIIKKQDKIKTLIFEKTQFKLKEE